MAQVNETVAEGIDHVLDIALWQWQSLPEVAAEIDEWDLLDQLNFIEEWPIEEDRLLFLERHAADDSMSLEQRARFEELKRIVACNRPIIQRLQNS